MKSKPEQPVPKYIKLNGDKTHKDDPERLTWYGWCTYWTDDWSKLNYESLPTCPHCGAFGFQIEFCDWMEGAKNFENQGNDCYLAFLLEHKEKCYGTEDMLEKDMLELYKEWYAKQ